MSTATSLGNELLQGQSQGAEALFDAGKMPVFWNWELVYTCNYRCSYCNYTAVGWESHYSMNAYPGLKRLAEVWTRLRALYGSCHIELSGGECSSYPRFYDLMGILVGLHTVTLDTNLSFDVRRFASILDLRRIRISASFHPQFSRLEPFLEKCTFLQANGIAQIFINYVAYPNQLAGMARVKREFHRAGLQCYIQPFQGVYRKTAVYPDGYTEEEKRLIDEALTEPGIDTELSRVRFAWKGSTMRSGTENQLRKIEAERQARGEGPLLEKKPGNWSPFPWADLAPSAEERPRREPVLCRMGQKYAKTYANGDTFRCCAQLRDDMPWHLFREKVYLGNLFFDDGLKLLDEPAWCDYDPCPCDRCMVLGQETRWVKRWSAPNL